MMTLAACQRRQERIFGVGAPVIATAAGADAFLNRVGIALRYGANDSVPLASLQRAFAGDDPSKTAATRAAALTNGLLGRRIGVEVHVVAGRVAVVHRRVMPALYALVRRGRALGDLRGLSLNAQTALALIRERREVSAGDVRKRLGLPADARNDPAYAALGELMAVLLVDRGPFDIPRKGIHYLPPEGYPYHLVHEAHADLVAASEALTPDSAADVFLGAYLAGAAFGRARKLATMFKVFLSPREIDGSLARLVRRGSVRFERFGETEYCVSSSAAPPRGQTPGSDPGVRS